MNDSYRNLFNLADQVAVVTGGCGLLGRQFCRGLASFGARVAVLDLDLEASQALAAEIAQETGIAARGWACDVRDPTAIENAAHEIEAALGTPHILVNNAASKTQDVDAFFAPVEEYSLETWREIMAVNLDGMFSVARIFGGHMADSGGGSIVQTASVYGLLAPDQRIYEGSEYLGRAINTPAVYTASKAGVIGLTKHLATYWGARRVRVNALVPGGVESGQNETFKHRYGQRVPLGRMARADEMVGAVVFLASDASSYITGQVLSVDGGLSAW